MTKETVNHILSRLKLLELDSYYFDCFKLACIHFDINRQFALKEIHFLKTDLNKEAKHWFKNIYNKYNSPLIIDKFCVFDLMAFSCIYDIKFKWKIDTGFLNATFNHISPKNANYNSKSLLFESDVLDLFKRNRSSSTCTREEITEKLLCLYKSILYDTGLSTPDSLYTPPIKVKCPKPVYPAKEEKERIEEFFIKDDIRIYKTYDIDAVLGIVSPMTINNISKTNFQLRVDKFTKFIKKTKKYYFLHRNQIMSMGECDGVHIGSFPINLGFLDLFIIFPGLGKEVKKKRIAIFNAVEAFKYYKKEEDISENRVRCSKQISYKENEDLFRGVISTEYIECFFDFLEERLTGEDPEFYEEENTFFYFVELLGNKLITQSNSPRLLIKKLDKDLNLEFMPHVKIDFCIENSTDKDYVLVTKASEILKLGQTSFNNILFSESIINCNKSYHSNLYDKSTKEYTLLFANGPIEKINFYSALEDKTKCARNETFLPTISNLFFQISIIQPSKRSEKSIKSYVSKLEKIISGLRNEPMAYRKEVRIDQIFLMDAVKLLDSELNDNYIAIPTCTVNENIASIFKQYIDIIGNLDFNNPIRLFEFYNLENVFQSFYLRGTKNWHMTPSFVRPMLEHFRTPLKDFLFISPENIKFEFKITKMICNKTVQKFFWNFYLDYNKNTHTWENILEVKSLSEGLDVVIAQMIKDFSERFKITLSTLSKCPKGFFAQSIKSVDVIQMIFTNKLRYQASLSYKIMINILQRMWNICETDYLNAMNRNKLYFIFFVSPQKKELKFVKICYLPKKSAEIVNRPFTIESKIILDYTSYITEYLKSYDLKSKHMRSSKDYAKVLWIWLYKQLTGITWQNINTSCFFGTLGHGLLNRAKSLVTDFFAPSSIKRHNDLKKNKIKEYLITAIDYDPLSIDYTDNIDELSKYFVQEFEISESFYKAYKYIFNEEKREFIQFKRQEYIDIVRKIDFLFFRDEDFAKSEKVLEEDYDCCTNQEKDYTSSSKVHEFKRRCVDIAIESDNYDEVDFYECVSGEEDEVDFINKNVKEDKYDEVVDYEYGHNSFGHSA